jgi:L-amino acid N-acyltransferase YncA
LRFRCATAADATAIFDIHVDSVTTLCASHYSADQIGRWFEDRSARNYLGAIHDNAIWIAERDGVAIGYAEFFTGAVTSLFVGSAMAGRGVGSRLLCFAIDGASLGHSGPIRLEATLNGEEFYRKLGFSKTGDGFVERPSGLRLETVLMELYPLTGR